jgi:hypothetical protein
LYATTRIPIFCTSAKVDVTTNTGNKSWRRARVP